MRTIDQKKLGSFIADRRRMMELTQKELAARLNVTEQAVSKWERGLGLPEIATWPDLSDALGVRIDELINGECDAEGAAVAGPASDLVEKTVAASICEVRRQRRAKRIVIGLASLAIVLVMLIGGVRIWMFYLQAANASFDFSGAEGLGTFHWVNDDMYNAQWQFHDDGTVINNGDMVHFTAIDPRCNLVKVEREVMVTGLLKNILARDETDPIFFGAIEVYGRRDPIAGVSLCVVKKDVSHDGTYIIERYEHLYINDEGRYVTMVDNSNGFGLTVLDDNPKTTYRGVTAEMLSMTRNKLMADGYTAL